MKNDGILPGWVEEFGVEGTAKTAAAVDDLSVNPYPKGVRKLVGSDHAYRIRMGDYRLIYHVFENKLVIEIVRVRHRKDAYNK